MASVLKRDELLPLLVCPVCRAGLGLAEDLVCSGCGKAYPVLDGVPQLLHPDSVHAVDRRAKADGVVSGSAPRRGTIGRLVERCLALKPPRLTCWLDETIFAHLNRSTPDMKILNLGSGAGLFDDKIRSDLRLFQMDVGRSERVELVADGHYLPFADGSLDGVFSNAVLEHVQRPWLVAQEIERVLKPGGRAFMSVPFLSTIHDEHDYFRFTDKGLRILFSNLSCVAAGVSAGPASFLGPFLMEHLRCFLPAGSARRLLAAALYLPLWPLKFLDLLIKRSSHLRVVADAFYFVGEKPDRAPDQ